METLPNQNTEIMSYKEWALTIFITGLPLIGFIMLFVWAFSDNININKKNYAKGSLLILVIALIIMFSFLFLFGGMALFYNLSEQ